ncbi:MAG: hypothetical protein MR631_00640 [Selenomonadales bacterium]|nr:hypothetical protein [Selenomonadales bacterium]
MKSVNLYFAENDIEGALSISSNLSKIMLTRLEKAKVAFDQDGLNGSGIYFLLIGTNKIYVGETGLDTLKKRILNKHTGDIDKLWHTVVGFKILDNMISKNELLYLENALCEYVHNHAEYECLTTNPSKTVCNVAYRDKHYKLSMAQIDICKTYLKDILFYLTMFPGPLFPELKNPHGLLFQYENKKRDVHGTAEISIHVKPGEQRIIKVKAGSKLSVDVSPHFSASASIQEKRMELEKEGKIKDRILLEDKKFASPTAAVEFLAGISLNGNICWKTVDEHKSLKEFLK